MSAQLLEILLVEDNENDIELTLRAFQRHRLANRIHVVRDGEEALDFLFDEALEHARPKLILLDLKLPKIDGLTVLREIRSTARFHDVPVVVMTSSREDRHVIESHALGVTSYIVKPIEFESFVETVRALGLYWALLNESPQLAQPVG